MTQIPPVSPTITKNYLFHSFSLRFSHLFYFFDLSFPFCLFFVFFNSLSLSLSLSLLLPLVVTFKPIWIFIFKHHLFLHRCLSVKWFLPEGEVFRYSIPVWHFHRGNLRIQRFQRWRNGTEGHIQGCALWHKWLVNFSMLDIFFFMFLIPSLNKKSL